MIVKDALNLTEQMIDLFKDAVNKKLDESSDIITPEMRKKIKIFAVSNSLHFTSTLTRGVSYNKRYSRKALVKAHKKYNTEWESKPYLTNVEFEIDENNIMHVTDIYILIKYDVINDQIITSLDMLDTLKEIYTIDASHEVGHVLDFIELIDGANYDEVNEKVFIPDDKATKDYYKWKEDLIKAEYESTGTISIDTMKLTSQKYYRLPAEARADIMGGVDRERALEIIYDKRKENGETVDINIEVIK